MDKIQRRHLISMNYSEIRNIIWKDKACNIHPKNRLFIFLFRWGCYFHKNKYASLPYKIFDAVFRALIKVSYNRYNHYPLEVQIGGGLRLPHNMGIVLSGKAVIGEYCTIFHEVTIGADVIKSGGAPTIGNHVFIGAGAKVIGDISIGDNVIIGAGAVVTKNVPDECTVVGYNRIVCS